MSAEHDQNSQPGGDPGPSSPASRIPWAVGVVLWVSLCFPILTSLDFSLKVNSALENFPGETLESAFHYGTPEFRREFEEAVRGFLPLGRVMYIAGAWFWLTLAVGLGALWLHRVAIRAGQAQKLRNLLVLAPLLVGLGLIPLHVSRNFAALAAQGLTSPSILGFATGEALVQGYVGGLVSVALLLYVAWDAYRRSQSDSALVAQSGDDPSGR